MHSILHALSLCYFNFFKASGGVTRDTLLLHFQSLVFLFKQSKSTLQRNKQNFEIEKRLLKKQKEISNWKDTDL
jgi:hypothetical protein